MFQTYEKLMNDEDLIKQDEFKVRNEKSIYFRFVKIITFISTNNLSFQVKQICDSVSRMEKAKWDI